MPTTPVHQLKHNKGQLPTLSSPIAIHSCCSVYRLARTHWARSCERENTGVESTWRRWKVARTRRKHRAQCGLPGRANAHEPHSRGKESGVHHQCCLQHTSNVSLVSEPGLWLVTSYRPRQPFRMIIVRLAYISPESQLARRFVAFISGILKPEY